jgi:uncharacterized phage infection (PIP) family protein YhgE
MVIDQRYIDTAIRIRKEFLSMNEKLIDVSSDIKNVLGKLSEENDNLSNIDKNLQSYDKSTAEKLILDKLMDMEKEANRLAKIYEPINKKIEELRKEEELLYDKIREMYPDLSDEEIVSEIHPFLEK